MKKLRNSLIFKKDKEDPVKANGNTSVGSTVQNLDPIKSNSMKKSSSSKEKEKEKGSKENGRDSGKENGKEAERDQYSGLRMEGRSEATIRFKKIFPEVFKSREDLLGSLNAGQKNDPSRLSLEDFGVKELDEEESDKPHKKTSLRRWESFKKEAEVESNPQVWEEITRDVGEGWIDQLKQQAKDEELKSDLENLERQLVDNGTIRGPKVNQNSEEPKDVLQILAEDIKGKGKEGKDDWWASLKDDLESEQN
eukprot:TRINITY_DN7281_c0_g1_i1.p2 TRINITY_DN7281_c0_g1~~TRINITY_DN7281_c0_g1_i1.p2  ORF type:complete len:252 (+),score=96.99 TRINITY_DN7281_c0_g1_i1:277-1032(+)